MDWNLAIERNREALKRILSSLIAMTGLAGLAIGQSPPLWGRCPAGQRGVGREGPASATRPTLPRHLHRAVLRLLRPAEAAVRRLVIVAARDLVVELPPSRPRKPGHEAEHAALRGLGLAVFLSPADAARAAASARRVRAVRKVTLPLFDPIRLPRPGRPRYVPAHAAPRILSFDGATPHRLPPPPPPDDLIDASRLAGRLAALTSALDDLPREARRFARLKARRAQSVGYGRPRRASPLRPGRPPGLSAANRRRPAHEVHEVLGDLHYFASQTLRPPDTS